MRRARSTRSWRSPGKTIGVDDVSTVLGLVGRDLLFDLIDAVVTEDGPRAFALADRAVESGTRPEARVPRVVAGRARHDGHVGGSGARRRRRTLAEGERERLTALRAASRREDLMRAFDLLSKAEQEIRNASHPRYHFEMVLLRWMHLRKLVPLADLFEQLGASGTKPAPRTLNAPTSSKVAPTSNTVAPTSSKVAPTSNTVAPTSSKVAPTSNRVAPTSDKIAPTSRRIAPTSSAVAPTGNLKDALLAEIRAGKGFFYNTVVAQAQKIEVVDDRVTFTFLPGAPRAA